MTKIEFVVHADCEIPCIHMVISENDEIVSDNEVNLSEYVNLISIEKLIEYSNALADRFIKIVDVIESARYNINTFNAKIQDMIAISKKKTEVDNIIYPKDNESENIDV